MRRLKALSVGGVLLLLCGGASSPDARAPQVPSCATRSDVLGLSRVVEVDANGGPIFGRGALGGYDFLAKGEIVLIFEDDPSTSCRKSTRDGLLRTSRGQGFAAGCRLSVDRPNQGVSAKRSDVCLNTPPKAS